ncbi:MULTISPECIES: hypothetical protein [Agrobacterium]|uniref:hypothetical protein n=1 Tax=Agrobacterium TaxID=357 RepID=UPI0009BB9DE2|nr:MULTISPECIES: hypothetical protein [Agrobacterium]QCL72138.1 hypothetical protein CFBP5499_00910 [Agrobacterium tumefaciens]
MADKPANALAGVRSVFAAFSQGLENIRSQVEDLKAERDAIERMPVDEATAHRRAEMWVSSAVTHAMERAPSPSRFATDPGRWRLPGFDVLADALVAYQGDVLASAMKQEISEIYQSEKGLTDAERAKRLADLDQSLLNAELSEEALIREAETSGITVNRRADADPRAVLAHQDALP